MVNFNGGLGANISRDESSSAGRIRILCHYSRHVTSIVSSKLGLLEPYFSLWIIEESSRKEIERVVRRKKEEGEEVEKNFSGEKKICEAKIEMNERRLFQKFFKVYLKNSRERFVG